VYTSGHLVNFGTYHWNFVFAAIATNRGQEKRIFWWGWQVPQQWAPPEYISPKPQRIGAALVHKQQNNIHNNNNKNKISI